MFIITRIMVTYLKLKKHIKIFLKGIFDKFIQKIFYIFRTKYTKDED